MRFQYSFSGRGTIKKEQNGNNFSLDYLIRQTLNYSDNNATNSLIDFLGRDYIKNKCFPVGALFAVTLFPKISLKHQKSLNPQKPTRFRRAKAQKARSRKKIRLRFKGRIAKRNGQL